MDVLNIIENITDKNNKLIFLTKQKGDVFRTEADIKMASKIIGYKPKISLKEGLMKQIELIKKNIF